MMIGLDLSFATRGIPPEIIMGYVSYDKIAQKLRPCISYFWFRLPTGARSELTEISISRPAYNAQ
jgi:hypothetical protein